MLARLDGCDYGVLLVSPAFLGSTFILEEELPRFVGESATKGALPVALKRVPLDGSRQLSGVGDHQIFRDAEGRCFSETRGPDRPGGRLGGGHAGRRHQDPAGRVPAVPRRGQGRGHDGRRRFPGTGRRREEEDPARGAVLLVHR